MNILTTVGYLTVDPAMSTTPSGQQVCKFRLGSNNKRRDENNNMMTNFYNCTVWGKMGETIARLFHKGSRIMVSGDLTIRDYVDKNGAPRVSIDIDVRDWDFGERSGGGGHQQQPQAPTPVPQQPVYQSAVQQPMYQPPVQQPAYQPAAQAPAAVQAQAFTPVQDDLPF